MDQTVFRGDAPVQAQFILAKRVMPTRKTWIVTTSGDRPTREIVKELEAQGFAVDQVLDEIGAITGAADDAVAPKLRAIDGVADVTPEGTIDIGPPDAPTTW